VDFPANWYVLIVLVTIEVDRPAKPSANETMLDLGLVAGGTCQIQIVLHALSTT
jgi:hypothetical protein